jgi:hypothetical protein
VQNSRKKVPGASEVPEPLIVVGRVIRIEKKNEKVIIASWGIW